MQDLNLQRMPPCDILDIGCGGGFFLFIAQALGHHGLEPTPATFQFSMPWPDELGIERTIYLVQAFEPLPDFGLSLI